MIKYEDNLTSRINGNNLQPLLGASVTVTSLDTGLPASLYSDNGVTPLAQPLTTDNNGYFGFYAPDGKYTLTFSGSRFATFTRQIVLEDPADNPYATKAELAAASGATLVGGAVINVASMIALLSAIPVLGRRYALSSYHAALDIGGGAFYWDASRSAAAHDGGTVISPQAPFPNDWTDPAQISAWYAPRVGNGCWVRVSPGYYPDEFGANYVKGVDQTPMIQQAENRAAAANQPLRLRCVYAEQRTQLVFKRAPQIIGDSGGFGSLRSGKLVPGRKIGGAVLVSRVAGDFAVKVKPDTYDFGGRIENLTLLGRYDTTETKVAGSGISLDQFGWSAAVRNFTVEDFADCGVEIGYLQDTTFDRLTILGCGNTSAKAALVFKTNANFLYFNDPHLEDGNYLLRSYAMDANGTAWEIHWKGLHAEVGNYTGTPDPTLEHRYATPCFSFEGAHRQWYFHEGTFVPVGASYLMAANGGTIDSQPYFMQGDQVAGFKFSKCSWLAPTTSIDPINFATTTAWAKEFGANIFEGFTFRGLNPTKANAPVSAGIAEIRVGLMRFYDAEVTSQMNGIRLSAGRVEGVTFADASTTAKTGGRLIYGTVAGAVMVGENEYQFTTPPFIYVSKECVLSDHRSLSITNIAANTTLNMELEKPGTVYQFTAVATVNDITNCQRGRRIRLFNTSGGNCTISQTPSLYPNAAAALVMAHLTAVELVGDVGGAAVRF